MKIYTDPDGEISGIVVAPIGFIGRSQTLDVAIKKKRSHCMTYPHCKGKAKFIRHETNEGVDCVVRQCELCGLAWNMTKSDYEMKETR